MSLVVTPQDLVRKLRTYRRMPFSDKALLVPAWCMLGLSRAVVLNVPFRRFSPLLGTVTGVAPWVPLVDVGQAMRARQIGRVVRMAARYTPWESNCFPQAMTARILLGCFRIPCAMFLGLKRGEDGLEKSEMKAHAWVISGPVAVVGGQSFRDFTVVACYASRPVAFQRRDTGQN